MSAPTPPSARGTLRAVSRPVLAAAFTEWERRFRAEPARFMADTERLASTSADVGDLQAAYLLEILDEQSKW